MCGFFFKILLRTVYKKIQLKPILEEPYFDVDASFDRHTPAVFLKETFPTSLGSGSTALFLKRDSSTF